MFTIPHFYIIWKILKILPIGRPSACILTPASIFAGHFLKEFYKDVDFSKFNEDAKLERFEENLVAPKIDDADMKKRYAELVESHNKYFKNDKPVESFEVFRDKTFANDTRLYLENLNESKGKGSRLEMIYNTAIENNFVSLYFEKASVNGEFLDVEGKFYLLDGFRRLLFDHNFCNKSDRMVYVKVYSSSTSDTDIMKLMFHFNLWKFPQGIDTWLDRGWRFFLYNRLGISFRDVKSGYY